MKTKLDNLSAFRKFNANLEDRWLAFSDKRQTRLAQEARYGSAAEKVAEDILQDLFTVALDWRLDSINNQIQYADMVLTHLGLKRIIVEAKRPGSLSWNQVSLEKALEQARRYAAEQRVTTIAVGDGTLFYAADIKDGGLEDRAEIHLGSESASPNLWWLSVDGIYRPAEDLATNTQPENDHTVNLTQLPGSIQEDDSLIHPKYKVPARCFAYVGDPLKPNTWKLPFRLMDGGVDEKHLPGAIRAVISNYRGAHIKTIPEKAIPAVLVRLGKAVWEIGKMPEQTAKPLATYQQLDSMLYQLGYLEEIKR